MTYIGQQPATTFDAGIQDRFTGLSSNTVTLTHEIAAEEDILVVWNNIVQDKNTYSVGGTGNKTLTLGGTLVSADVVTVYYLNKVMQSVNPTAGSVGITELNVSDGSNGQALTTNGSGTLSFATVGGDNTPSFSVYLSGNQSINSDSHTKVTFDSEYWDTDNAFASNKFTVPSGEGGKYAIAASLGWRQWNTSSGSVTADKRIQIQVYINGSGVNTRGLLQTNNTSTESGQNNISVSTAGTIDLSEGDYIEIYATHTTGHAAELYHQYTWFTGHKLIGV